VGRTARERLEQLSVRGEPPVPPPPPPPAWLGWEPLQRARWKLDFDPLAAAQEEGGPKGLARSVALRSMRPHTYHQDELNRAVVDGLQELAERVDRLAWELELEAGLSAAGRAHARRLIEAARVRPSPDHPLISMEGEDGEAVLAFDVSGYVEDPHPYRSFEDVFRGSQRLIRARQEGYLELLEDRSWVLDAGCGRGEFLELLREHGIEGRGVDLDPGMVELSREKGLDVEEGDVVEHLGSLADASVPAIFAAQVVEHLPPDVLVELLRRGARKLEPGGVAIFETVNPHRPSALKAFWVDPTHHHPLFPEVLLAFCRFAGYSSGRVLFPGGSGDFGRDVYDMPDYAVVVHR
jgi:SAM-dependent methyltransferase